MQPDPQIYLWRLSRDLRNIVLSGAVADVGAALAIERAAEMLAQLSVRETDLPGVVGGVVDEQQGLLSALSLLSAELGLTPVDAPAVDALGVIPAYDARAKAIELAVGAVGEAATGPGADRWRALALRACDLENRVRRDAADAVARQGEAEVLLGEGEEDRPALPTPDQLSTYLRSAVPGAGAIRVDDVRQQKGVNTKDILFLTVSGFPDWPTRVVMRRLRRYNVNTDVSMTYEHRLLNLLREAGVQAPRSLWLEPGDALDQPFVILEQVPGEARKAESLRARGRHFAEQIARHLASIHRLDPAISGLPETGLPPRQRVLAQIDKSHRLWRANHVEPSALMEAAFVWARGSAARLSDETVLVHGDFDLRNMLIDGDEITAVLDWERSHIGHPAEDLAYCRTDVEQLMPWAEFLHLYESYGGKPVTDWELGFFQIWGQIHRLIAIGRAVSGYARRDHSDFLLASSGFIEQPRFSNTLSENLTKLLEATAQ